MNEEDKEIAASLSKELKKAFRDIAIDLKKPLPISTAIVQRRESDVDSGQIKFPVIVVSLYGTGVNGVVLKIQDARGQTYAMRVGYIDQTILDLQRNLAKYEMAPHIYYVGQVEGTARAFTIMDRISATLDDYLKTRANIEPAKVMVGLKCLLDKKYLLRLVHGDMHMENIAILKDGTTLGFIDFEFSLTAETPTLTTLDFIPLLGNLKYLARSVKPPKREQLHQLSALIAKYYRETFHMDIRLADVSSRSGGGYQYEKLTSYFKGDKEASVSRAFWKVFPSFQMPRIVP